MLTIHSYHATTSNTDDLTFSFNQPLQSGTYQLIDYEFYDTDATPWCWPGIDNIQIYAPNSGFFKISLGTLWLDVAGEAAAIKAAFEAVTNVLFAVADQSTVTVVWNNTLKRYTITPDNVAVTYTIYWSGSSVAGVFRKMDSLPETVTNAIPLVLDNIQWLDEHPTHLEVRIREASGTMTSSEETRAQLVVETGVGPSTRLLGNQSIYINGPTSELNLQINRENYTAFSTTAMPYTNEWALRFRRI